MAQAGPALASGMETPAPLWHDRRTAGMALATRLDRWRGDPGALVIGLPRGGVVVAAAVAGALELPLASWAVRKLAQPEQPEVAIGALAPGGVLLWEAPYGGLPQHDGPLRRRLVHEQDRELRRRQQLYGDPPRSALRARTLLVVDDGVATGLTVRAALLSLRQAQPAGLVLAVPVLDQRVQRRLEPLVDELIALVAVPQIRAVGLWYRRFEPVSDAEVLSILRAARPLDDMPLQEA